MKRHLRFLIYGLFLTFILTGCAQETIVPVRQNEITAEENQWLARSYRVDKNGWIFLHIEGKPFERGFQRGYLTADETDEFLKTTAYILKFQTAKEPNFFVESAAKLFRGKVSKEYVEEMKGMVAGMEKAGKKVTLDQMLFMNGFIDVWWYWWSGDKKKSEAPGCSAFIATGEATADSKIVMAQNTWIGYAIGIFCNIIIDIVPDKGHRILIQSWGALNI